MIRDYNLILSSAQVITDSSAASTYHIDTLAAGDAIAPGAMIEFRVGTAFTAGTSIKFDVQTDSTDGFGSAVTIFSTGAIAETDLTVNKVIARAVLPVGVKRYIRAYYTTVGTHSTGTLSAEIVLDGDKLIDGLL